MPTIGEVLGTVEARLFVDRERELALFRRWLVADTPLPELLNVSGPGGVGKSALLQAFRRVAVELGRPVVLVDGHDFVATPAGLVEALGGATVDDAVAALNRALPLLLLDTFEEIGHLSPFLQQELLPRLDTRVKVVVAGRYPLGQAWSREGGWHTLIRPLPLAGFTAEDSDRYLRRRGLDDPRLAAQVLRATRGHPLALSLAADLVLQLGVRDFTAAHEWHVIVRALVEQLLRDIPDPQLRALVEACAVLRQFDEAMLAAVSGQADIGAAFDRLCRLSIVRPAEHGLMLHDDVQVILADDLRWRRPERADELRRRALAYCRQRTQTASPAEREWLVRERFYLWQNAVLQALIFDADRPGDVHVMPGGPEDREDILRVWSRHACLPEAPPVEELSLGALEALLDYGGTQFELARTRQGEALGFGYILPVCRESLPVLPPAAAQLVRACWRPAELAALPATAAESTVYFLPRIVTTEVRPQVTAAALARWFLGFWSLGHTYLAATSWPPYRSVLEATGFQRLPAAQVWPANGGAPIDGYALDLSHIGLDAWLEALLSGRRVPRALRPEELEQEVRLALLHWHDDGALAQSPLVDGAAAANDAAASAPEAVRQTIRQALARARAAATPDQELAYRALELAYLQRGLSHERAAERLAVSRTTFFRLLKRGIHGVAQAWDLAQAGDRRAA